MDEELKKARFKKVASGRAGRIIELLRLLENCANRNNYEYSDKDVEYMFAEITGALNDAKAAFKDNMGRKAGKNGFSFPERKGLREI